MRTKKLLIALIIGTGILSQAQAQSVVAKLSDSQVAKLSKLFEADPDQAVLDIYQQCMTAGDCTIYTESGKKLRLSADFRSRFALDKSKFMYDGGITVIRGGPVITPVIDYNKEK